MKIMAGTSSNNYPHHRLSTAILPSSTYHSSSESDSLSSSPTSSTTSSSSSSIRKGRIDKVSNERRERREVMEKLQKMVPSAREGDSQLKLLQNIINYIVSLQRQLEEDIADSENQHYNLDVTSLSDMFARFSTKTARFPLRPGQQVASH
ncbi:unnamed protein product [Enterobius vermicularis]|uniref:BHLH domain-containing protein n=1 Tax=Enterobius vermicularis TaxID=51028 RepID=A0A0N4VLB7_ENTVE|nr:unnamed protein product [Enterobius vermicularis]